MTIKPNTWISVKDDSPTILEQILVYTENEKIFLVVVFVRNSIEYWKDLETEIKDVTHFMRLSKPTETK